MLSKINSILKILKFKFKRTNKSKLDDMELINLLNNSNATIIDVRTKGEFNSGHVKDSINIPVDQVPEKAEEFSSMSKPIILCCASGARSGLAADYLSNRGIDEVYNGGSWKNIELQLIK